MARTFQRFNFERKILKISGKKWEVDLEQTVAPNAIEDTMTV